jgi:hypothetical protein
MGTIAFPLIYLMVAINPATGQWERQEGEYPDQKTCLVARQAMADAGNYFCLAYKDTHYMMEVLEKGHWLPLDGRGMTYGSGHGVDNQSYTDKKECLAARQENLGYQIGSAHPASYRCVPYSFSYVDKDDPPSWTLRYLFRDHSSSDFWGFYTRADCVSMGRYQIGRMKEGTSFECIHFRGGRNPGRGG